VYSLGIKIALRTGISFTLVKSRVKINDASQRKILGFTL
jgi:hypothetical protein